MTRVSTVRLWVANGPLMRQCTYITCVLWQGRDRDPHRRRLRDRPHNAYRARQLLAAAYLGVTLGVQREWLKKRAAAPAGPAGPASGVT